MYLYVICICAHIGCFHHFNFHHHSISFRHIMFHPWFIYSPTHPSIHRSINAFVHQLLCVLVHPFKDLVWTRSLFCILSLIEKSCIWGCWHSLIWCMNKKFNYLIIHNVSHVWSFITLHLSLITCQSVVVTAINLAKPYGRWSGLTTSCNTRQASSIIFRPNFEGNSMIMNL